MLRVTRHSLFRQQHFVRHSHFRVVIIGGGIVGASVLYHLARCGWKDVALIERAEVSTIYDPLIIIVIAFVLFFFGCVNNNIIILTDNCIYFCSAHRWIDLACGCWVSRPK